MVRDARKFLREVFENWRETSSEVAPKVTMEVGEGLARYLSRRLGSKISILGNTMIQEEE